MKEVFGYALVIFSAVFAIRSIKGLWQYNYLMGISKDSKRQSQLNSNAARTMKGPKTTETKNNTQERANEVEAFKASRPKAPNRENMIAWAATNPNKKSNASRRLNTAKAAKRATRPPKH